MTKKLLFILFFIVTFLFGATAVNVNTNVASAEDIPYQVSCEYPAAYTLAGLPEGIDSFGMAAEKCTYSDGTVLWGAWHASWMFDNNTKWAEFEGAGIHGGQYCPSPDALVSLLTGTYTVDPCPNPWLNPTPTPTDTPSPTPTPTPTPTPIYSRGDRLSQDEAAKLLSNAGITTSSSGNCSDRNNPMCTSLEGIRRTTIDYLIDFKNASHVDIVVTGGTEVGHEPGNTSHANGFKVDIRSSQDVTDYIIRNFNEIPPRKNKNGGNEPSYSDGLGNIYVLEGNPPHWDITYKPPIDGTNPYCQ